MNIAIFSPSKNPYSETFIQAHKNRLKGKIFYYYGFGSDIKLEGQEGTLAKDSFLIKVWHKIIGKKYNQRKWNSLLASIRTNNIDIILVEYGNHANNLRDFLEKTKCPYVVHFHGFDASVGNTIKACGYYKETFKSASKIITVSTVMLEKLKELGCPESKLVYNVYGPHPEFEKITSDFTRKQFVAIGRFTDKKAPYYLILAFKTIVEYFPDSKLIIAGNGILYNACKNLIRYFNLEENIILKGIITPEEYRKLLQESLAFVQHSVTGENGDMEGTPLAVLEASAAGLPVISTFHAGIPDVIINNKTGLLVHEHDVEGMSEAMLKVLNDCDLAKKLGKNGKKNISAHFSMERHINTLNDILNNVHIESKR